MQKLEQRISRAKVNINSVPEDEQKEKRLLILKRIAKYRPSMFVTTEYFTVGHDQVTSLFEGMFFESFVPKQKEIGFFFAGVGDGRNLLQTLEVISELEDRGKVPKRKYHILANDIQKSALARDLVIWMLLDEMKEMEESKEEERELVLNALFFVFIGTLIPRFIFERVLETIGRAIEALGKGKQPLEWLFVHEKDFKPYIEALEYWRGEARKTFTSTEMMTKVQLAFMVNGMGGLMGDAQTPFMKEKALYTDKAILFPSSKVLSTHDPELEGLLEKYRAGSRTDETMELLKKHV